MTKLKFITGDKLFSYTQVVKLHSIKLRNNINLAFTALSNVMFLITLTRIPFEYRGQLDFDSILEIWLPGADSGYELAAEIDIKSTVLSTIYKCMYFILFFLFIQYFQRGALLSSIASLPSGPL